jgi:DNA-binding GntR family transcriptional regulator
MEGLFAPGTRLSEEAISGALGVSRNTLREAFRLLSHERLLVHHLNRGIFVPVLAREDIADLYAVRRLIEGGAVRLAGNARPADRAAVLTAAKDGEAAAADGDWLKARTADLRFHLAIAALASSPRINELMRRVLTELALVFHAVNDPRTLHESFVTRNRIIAELVMAGEGERAQHELLRYLDIAERELLAVYGTAGTSLPSERR